VALVVFDFLKSTLDRVGWWLPALGFVVLCLAVGAQFGRALLRTGPGKRLLKNQEERLRSRYADDLNSGRRWLQFYYKDEDIAPYVPQILYFLESDPRFETIDEALAFAKQHRRANTLLSAQVAKEFAEVAKSSNLMVLSTVDASGKPASRLMRFVKTDRPGVWYISTSPDGPKVKEFDAGKIALVTVPSDNGGTINSNRVTITRTVQSLADLGDLFESQIPGYLEGVSVEEQRRELVYELRFQSARVDTWFTHDAVDFELDS
jgi:hypothetical protein